MSDIPQAAQGSPQALHLGAAHCPQAVPAAGVGPHPQGGFPSQPGKAQVGRGWGEGRRSLRGFQPGNKTERTNPASECAITSHAAGPGRLAYGARPFSGVTSVWAQTSRPPSPELQQWPGWGVRGGHGRREPECVHTLKGWCGARGPQRKLGLG